MVGELLGVLGWGQCTANPSPEKQDNELFILWTADNPTPFRLTEKKVALPAVHRIRHPVHDAPSTATLRRSFPDDT